MIQVYCEKGWKKRNEEKIRHFKTNKKLVTAELALLATGLAYKTATVKADTTANDQAAKASTATDETPTSKKTSDEITAAFQTGDETGLKYESVKVEKIAGMTKDIIRGGEISTYQSLINAGVKFYDFEGKEAKYGDPIKVNISAALKWVKNL